MVRKYSVTLHGHRTSFSLEEEFFSALKHFAEARGQSVAGLIAEVDEGRAEDANLSSALRVFVLRQALAGGSHAAIEIE
jgi:predicted DNA-binding ribbon-helix-helix protein